MSPGAKFEAAEVAELVRTTAPPPGFEPFATAIATVAQAPERVFGVAVDPMRPADVIKPTDFGMPPHCPACFSLLQSVVSNKDGDTLFTCLFDGYEAVVRRASMGWEPRPRPGTAPVGWKPPTFGEDPASSKPGPVTIAWSKAGEPVAAATTIEAPSVTVSPLPAPEGSVKTLDQAVAESPSVNEEATGDDGTEWLTWADAATVSGKSAQDLYKITRQHNVPRRKDNRGRVLVNMDVLLKVIGG